MKDKNSIITIEIGIMIFAFIALVFAFGTYFSKKIVVKEKPKEVVVEEKVDENAEFKDIISNVSLINTNNKNSITDIFVKEINIEDISKPSKLYSVIYNLYLNENYSEESYDNENGETIVTKYIDLDKVNELYKKLFNDTIDDYSLEEEMCPLFQLNENRFYIDDTCGKASKNKMISYIYKKVVGKNSLDIYLALGVLAYSNRSYDVYRYDDYIGKVNNIVLNTDSELFFSFDDKNYKDFSLYMVHFVKNGERYYFRSVRRAIA